MAVPDRQAGSSLARMQSLDALERDLRRRMDRHPADRYPVQHATACFHLGTVLTDAGRFEEAQEPLRRAEELFGTHLPVEQAKARNALGAAQRGAGRHAAAADSFRRAADAFRDHRRRQEAGAAWFNLGLVERERRRRQAAAEAFRTARELLEEDAEPAVAGAAARELGSLLLEQGELDVARQETTAAVELARRIGDHAAVGLASNVLGLVELAADDADAAVEAFRTAAAAQPRTVRPEGHAVATANLALAHERLGERVQARVAARRALALVVDGPVHEQAREVLGRLGDPAGDLARVMEWEPTERWSELMRDELARWADADRESRQREAGAWIAAQTAAEDPVGHAVVLVGGLLELPPRQLQQVVDGLLDAWAVRDEEAREAFRNQLSRAVVRFHVPQWMRLRSVLEASARAHGDAEAWG